MNPSLRNRAGRALAALADVSISIHRSTGVFQNLIYLEILSFIIENAMCRLGLCKLKFSIIITIINLQGLYEAGYWHSYKGLN